MGEIESQQSLSSDLASCRCDLGARCSSFVSVSAESCLRAASAARVHDSLVCLALMLSVFRGFERSSAGRRGVVEPSTSTSSSAVVARKCSFQGRASTRESREAAVVRSAVLKAVLKAVFIQSLIVIWDTCLRKADIDTCVAPWKHRRTHVQTSASLRSPVSRLRAVSRNWAVAGPDTHLACAAYSVCEPVVVKESHSVGIANQVYMSL